MQVLAGVSGRLGAKASEITALLPKLSIRSVFTGDVQNFGRTKSGSMPKTGPRSPKMMGADVPGFRPKLGTSGSPDALGAGAVAAHHRALAKLAEILPGLAGVGGGALQSWRDRNARLRDQGNRMKQEEVFHELTRFLMAPALWTYGSMAAYQRKVLVVLGVDSLIRKLAGKDSQIDHLEKELKVLEAMTPVELASNHKSVFTREAIALIAEKSGTSEKFVNQVLLEHDILRADRRWYKILEQFGKQLPRSFEERAFMAEYDRPFSESELEQREEFMDKGKKRFERKKPPRVYSIWYRKPSCGGNRWSSRPPRWYPQRWKMWSERRARLAGVGSGQGGGDRGVPWGRLARFSGPGGIRPMTGSR